MSSNLRLRLTRSRSVAWPTIVLAGCCVSVFGLGFVGAAIGVLPIWAVLILNSLSLYALYIAMHDAAHGAVFRSRVLNEWLGRVSVFLVNPVFSFAAYRFIHMQHHRFTNEARWDPDMYVASSGVVSQFLRCITADVGYAIYYLKSWRDRPVPERVEASIAVIGGVTSIFLLANVVGLETILLAWLVPTRIATGLLAFGLAVLPHSPHEVEQRHDLYRASAVLVGWEPVMTPLLLFQNFHLVHHVVPSAPFYQARRIWYDNLEFFMARDPIVRALPSSVPPPTPASLAKSQIAPPPKVPRELRQ